MAAYRHRDPHPTQPIFKCAVRAVSRGILRPVHRWDVPAGCLGALARPPLPAVSARWAFPEPLGPLLQGDELTLRALSEGLGITIHVISSDEANWYLQYMPSRPRQPQGQDSGTGHSMVAGAHVFLAYVVSQPGSKGQAHPAGLTSLSFLEGSRALQLHPALGTVGRGQGPHPSGCPIGACLHS